MKLDVISHCTIDTIEINGSEYVVPGGPGCYCSLTARSLKFDVKLHTKFGSDFPLVNYLVEQKIAFEDALSTKPTTQFILNLANSERTLFLENISRDDWENSIKNTFLTDKLIQEYVNSKVSVSEKEMHDYFDKSDEFHKKEQVRALHIMVESEEEIRKIQKEIRRKHKTFSSLAKEYSLGPEGIQGGDLGYFEAGQMPEEFDDVFKLKINKISDIIRTPYGFHLFKVVGKVQERKMDFEESKSSIKKILLRDLQDQAFQNWFLTLKQNARIDIKYDVLDKIN